MALTKFSLGQRVRVVKDVRGHDGVAFSFIGSVGTITEIRMYYRVQFDTPINEHNNILCEEDELCVYEHTDIMEYLKDMLLERG